MIRKTFQFFTSWFSSDDIYADNTSGLCRILMLPPEILQIITEYLSVHEVNSLSRTCRTFYTLINNDNFWIHRVRCHFSESIAKLYTYDLFQEPEYIETNDEIRPSGFDHVRNDGELDEAAINSATHYNDEAIERRCAKMYISKRNFLASMQYFQFNEPKNELEIPLMKLIYFYLIDRKRTAAVTLNVVHRGNSYLTEQFDRDSLTSRVIHLRSVCWLELTGRVQYNIMPGKYEVIWRMKVHPGEIRMPGETEFTVVPSHGKMLIYKISENDFRNYSLKYGNHWFIIKMGQIVIYELSTVLIAIRNWNDRNWKSGVSWDCIELKFV
jgi:hypothetical protein